MKEKYDAVLVLGSGIKEDGSIPESAKVRIRKVIGLIKSGQVKNVIFSGKWTYKIDYIPPKTEAAAMAEYAKSMGLGEKLITLESKSITTVDNFCKIKEILIKKGWKKILLIMNEPYAERAFLNMKKVLGPKYYCEVILTNFQFPQDVKDKIFEKEKESLQKAINFLNNFQDGDDKAIYKAAMKDLRENYL